MNLDSTSPRTDLSEDSEDFPKPQLLLQGSGNDILTEVGGDFGQRQSIAENLLGDVEWLIPCMGQAICPGADLHTSDSGGEVRVYIDDPPTIHCFHRSCEEVLAEANLTLRSRISRSDRGYSVSSTAVDAKYLKTKVKDHEISGKIDGWTRWFNRVISKPLHPRSLFEKSPSDINQRVSKDQSLFLRLYHPKDIIWTGGVQDTGNKFFSTVDSLITGKPLKHQHISACTFKPNSRRRTQKDILDRRFLVVESDELSITQQTALLWALGKEWKLAAVVYSGGKSLHGWFRWSNEWDDPLAQREIKARLKAYHCDPSCLKGTQLYRLPGVMRLDTLQMQSIVYLNYYHSYAKR